MPPELPSFEWQQYLVLAEALSEISAEAAKRSAISRAYYAAFHVARHLYVASNPSYLSTPGAELHRDVWNWFVRHHARSHREIGLTGSNLKRFRERADYDDKFPGLDEQAVLQI